ncbi:putative phospholipase B-like 2 [Nilaparvata lugens]|uniref:putative phospholipase B-like 2 n=1 Tax=Nilaparvata lugens TaxID=108931 RepID=UPI000B99CE9E|nr:putative phospholipase B-like 2 [Nilaparvata lugens]
MLLKFISLTFCMVQASAHRPNTFYFTQKSAQKTVSVIEGVAKSTDSWTARGYFDNKVNRTGFGYLEIETNIKFDSVSQAYHAGYLEGFLTADLIYSRWYNMVRDWCKDDRQNCDKINKFIEKNSIWITEKFEKNGNETYWYQLKLFYVQLYGMVEGYNSNTKHDKLGLADIMWLNLLTEVGDIQIINNLNSTIPDSDHCSALIKIMPDWSDIYFGHVTWGEYAEMLRILKKYVFRYRTSPQDSTLMPGYEMSMSSYPGAIISIDDFYLISSGLAVMETTNHVYNHSIYAGIKPENIVWEEFRGMIANRLAKDGKTWHGIFARYNSGTYNNQWMVFDYNKFKKGKPLESGALWVSEQMPLFFKNQDVTNVLVEKGYWGSFNIPYFPEVYEMSGYKTMYETQGTWYSHSDAPRAKIFARDQGNVHDMDTFMELMRSNDFTKDPFAVCNCTPPYSAAGAISSRKDLNPATGSGVQERKSSGATDAKLTNSQLFKDLKFVAVSGPSTGTDAMLPVFKWSESPFLNRTHMSLPDEFNFHPVTYKWLYEQGNAIA